MEQPQQMTKCRKKYLLDKYFLATFVSPLCLTSQNNCGSLDGNSLDGWRLKINRFWMRYFFYCFWILLHFWDYTRALYKAHWTHCVVQRAIRYLPKDLDHRFDFCFVFVRFFLLSCVVFIVWNLRMSSTIKTITYFVKRFHCDAQCAKYLLARFTFHVRCIFKMPIVYIYILLSFLLLAYQWHNVISTLRTQKMLKRCCLCFGAKNRMKFIEWKMNEREKNRSNGFGLNAEKERRPHSNKK